MQRGTLLVEILVAAMVLGTILIVTATALGIALDATVSGKEQNDATFLLQEELEPLLTIRDKGWVANIVNGTYYVAPSGSSWTLVPTVAGETIGQFTRKVVISDVYRDQTSVPPGKIVDTGGTLDQSTRKAVATVSWQGFLPHSISATTYITRYKDSVQWVDTNKSEFDQGIFNGTTSQLTGSSPTDGEVILGAGGGGDWCTPNFGGIVEEIDLPKSGKATSVTAIFGEAYAGTGENASGESFADILITDENPPQASIYGVMDGYKTNDIFGEADYGYIATDNNHKEVVIIRLSTLPFIEYGYFNSPGNEFGESVFVANNIGYVVVKDKLYSFDLSSKDGSRPIKDPDGVTLSKEGTSVYIVGNYAYVSIKGNNNVQLDIIDISNPTNMVKVGSADVNNQSAQDVFVNGSGTRAYIVTNATSPDEKEFHIVDITNKANPVKVGPGYYTNGMNPEGIEVVPGGRAIIVGQGGEEYQVVNISNELAPIRCGGLNVDSGIFDSTSVLEPDNDAFTYIVTGDATKEFKIIEGGPGGAFATSGTFESRIIDSVAEVGLAQTAYNRLTATFNKPIGTDIQFQVAGADAGPDNTCNTASYTFVGDDGTTGDFFTTTTSPLVSAIPLSPGPGYKNSARCFRYRAYLTTSEATLTPILYDVTINYSP